MCDTVCAQLGFTLRIHSQLGVPIGTVLRAVQMAHSNLRRQLAGWSTEYQHSMRVQHPSGVEESKYMSNAAEVVDQHQD